MSITNTTNNNFKDSINNEFTILDFYSTTCIPCKAFARILEDISYEFPFINIVKTNVSYFPEIGREYHVEAVPTIVFLKNGVEVDREVGLMSEEEVIEKISNYYYGE